MTKTKAAPSALLLTIRQFLTGRYFGSVVTVGLALTALCLALPNLGTKKSTALGRESDITDFRSYPTVEVAEAIRVDSINMPREYSGTIKAARTSELGFKRTGILETVYVEQGASVAAGQVLAELDTGSLRASLAEAQAQKDGAQAVLDELISGPRQQTIAAARSEVEDFESQRELAEIEFQRKQRLLAGRAISEQEFDDTRSLLRSVTERLNAAKNRLAELEEGTRVERIRAQQAELARLDAMLQRIEIDIRESQLRAPFDGTIAQRLLDEGSIVNMGQPVLRVVEQQDLEAWIGIPPGIAGSLEIGKTYPLTVDQHKLLGQLKTVLPEIDPVTRTVTTRFKIQSPDDADSSTSDPVHRSHMATAKALDCLPLPGRMIRVRLEQSIRQPGIWIPYKSLARGQRGLWSVYVVTADSSAGRSASVGLFRLERRDVEILQIDTDRALVQGELNSGDLIVATGVNRVTPGQLVRIAPPE